MALLDKLIQAYAMSMAYDIRSPMLHMVGPPGCGKSSAVEELAELLGVELHIINLNRLITTEIEGVQMPVGTGEDMVLKMLPATFWSSLKERDILLMDEFLTGHESTYNALLDIFTSRRVGAFRLPKVFIVGASNTAITGAAALRDRLLHLPVDDPRKSVAERTKIGKILVDTCGLNPEVAQSDLMAELIRLEVMPMYEMLDSLKPGHSGQSPKKQTGTSIRNLIGQVQLRMVTSNPLKSLIEENNRLSLLQDKWQYVLWLKAPKDDTRRHYLTVAAKLQGSPKLTPVQATNLEMNLQIIELDDAKKEGA